MQHRGIYVCRSCHSFIHKQFSEKTLGKDLNTLEKLSQNQIIQTYVLWAQKRSRKK